MIRRHCEQQISQALADTPVVLLNGARQTGKTTLAQVVAAQIRAPFLTLDDAATLALAASDPDGFVRQLPRPIAIDEIQKAPALFPAIKLAVDRNRQPGSFLLTGSANVLTLPRLSESLAGRMEIVSLYPFSIGEIAGSREGFLARAFSAGFHPTPSASTPPTLLEWLVRGGYPEVTDRELPERRAAWFGSYLSTILQRDVRDLARVDALHSLPNLLRILAARSAGLLNLADLARDAQLSHTTMTRYLALLETVFLVHRLPAWSPNLGQRLVKAPKLHLVDSGLACHLIGASVARLLEDRTLLGRMLESFLAGEIRKQISWEDPRVGLHHFRTAAGQEVDLVLERPDGTVVALEVKASVSVAATDFAALKALRDRLGERFRTGLVLHLGDQVIPSGDRLWLAPVSVVWAP